MHHTQRHGVIIGIITMFREVKITKSVRPGDSLSGGFPTKLPIANIMRLLVAYPYNQHYYVFSGEIEGWSEPRVLLHITSQASKNHREFVWLEQL